MNTATPSPPDRPAGNGGRLSALIDGIRAITPITTQGQDGSFRRTPAGYTTPRSSGPPAQARPPWTFYVSSGNLYLTPGLLNGLPITTEQGDPLDAWSPPPLMSAEDLERRRPGILFVVSYAPILGTLFFNEGTVDEPIYTPYETIIGGIPTASQVLIRDMPEDFAFEPAFTDQYTDLYEDPINPSPNSFLVASAQATTDLVGARILFTATPEYDLISKAAGNPILEPEFNLIPRTGLPRFYADGRFPFWNFVTTP